MLDYIKKNDGGTFKASTFEPVEPKVGYAVGIEFGTVARFSVDAVSEKDIAESFLAIINHYYVDYVRARVLGKFINLDPIVVVADYREAVTLGIENGQREIYSFKDGKSLNTIDAMVKISDAISAVANEVEQVSEEFDDLFVVIGGDAKTNSKIKKALVAKIKGE